MSEQPIAPWLWRSGVGLLALVVAVGAILVIALALGFNSPRPLRSPDWEAADLPLVQEAPSNATARRLMGRSYADLTLEIEMAPLPSGDPGLVEYGLIYRAQDTDYYYAFVVGSDGYYGVLRMAGEEETQLVEWQLFPHIHRDRQANRLRVACAGSWTLVQPFLDDPLAALARPIAREGFELDVSPRELFLHAFPAALR